MLLSMRTKGSAAELEQRAEQGQQTAMDFDYQKSGPEDIYALGVPRDAKIVDVCTRDDHSNRMLANARKAKLQYKWHLSAESMFHRATCTQYSL